MVVLIVEDDEISREMLANTLRHAGFEVLTANDGTEALEILRAGTCRLVITDWEMPFMNGVELCQAIRRGEFPGYIYVILLTSRDSPEETVEGLSAGADDFITKPFDSAELVVRVQGGERVLSLETREVTIFALAKLAESRDPETGSHLYRVRRYCRVLAQQLASEPEYADEIDAEYVRLIYATSPLHDIGKVGIPDHVLLKPGLLSAAEFEVMKTHSSLGAETLGAALEQYPQAKFLKMARDIAATHHEHWDGSGYPNGLAGKQIPLCGRIVAVADVYDALCSKRVYKEAYGHEVARSIIIDAAGKHFDPGIVKAFLACEDQFVAIHQQFCDLNKAETGTALAPLR
ncbi:MAG TPA: HD domain-containing phosphohydrolase [Pirellulales bacterium]|nr:HD domain-containing phosphohydrolase [Pirellulales bacterium]